LNTPSVQRADPAARRRAIGIVIAMAILGTAGCIALDTWLDDLRELEARAARAALLQWLAGATAVTALTTTIVGIYLWRLGRRIVTALHFPPPGMPVIRDTVILQGKPARIRGLLIQGTGLALGLLGLALAAVMLLAIMRSG
jgi:hypothetical protein